MDGWKKLSCNSNIHTCDISMTISWDLNRDEESHSKLYTQPILKQDTLQRQTKLSTNTVEHLSSARRTTDTKSTVLFFCCNIYSWYDFNSYSAYFIFIRYLRLLFCSVKNCIMAPRVGANHGHANIRNPGLKPDLEPRVDAGR